MLQRDARLAFDARGDRAHDDVGVRECAGVGGGKGLRAGFVEHAIPVGARIEARAVGDQHRAQICIPQRCTNWGTSFRRAPAVRARSPTRACAPAAGVVCSAIVPPSSSRPSSKPVAKRRAASQDAGADERQDNVSRAYHDLHSVIVWGQLPPGSRISERVIGERLGLSRTPVRSALHRLEQEGFVSSAGKGRERRLIVAPLTRDDGQEVYFIVGHLEGLAARMAASLPAARRKALATRLRALNRELAAESRKREDAARVFDLDLEFHRSYVEGIVGPRLLTLHRAIKPQSERYSRLYVTVLLDELSASVKEHEAIAPRSRRAIPTLRSARPRRIGTMRRGAWRASSRSTASAEAGRRGIRASSAPSPRWEGQSPLLAERRRWRQTADAPLAGFGIP